MKIDGKVLIVDDDIDILSAGKLLLKRKFSQVSTCNLPEHIPQFLDNTNFDVILLDMNFGPGEHTGSQGFFWLKKILSIDPDTVVIMITAHSHVSVAVEAMKLGATDFIAKPWENEKVIASISAAIQLGKSRTEVKSLKATNALLVESNNQDNHQVLITQSEKMAKVQSIIQRCAPTDANVMILGQNGTGKELIAREIHRQSARHNKIFMSVDLGAISESLFESELFGHKKGAFTGAQHDRVGRIQAAEGGTLFLDEVGNLPLYLQAKLLTVLEQREFTPLGSNQAIPFSVRVISATNVNKQKLLSDRHFRQDLRFRLNTVEIELPRLNERTVDIEIISNYYIHYYGRRYQKDIKTLSPLTLDALKAYSWPGNIRELRHAIERAVILCHNNELQPNDFELSMTEHCESSQNEAGSDHSQSQSKSVQSEELNLEVIERQTIQQALQKHKFNISHTAKTLGLTRAALYRRMEKHGL